jgi:CHAT domain-containing protein
MAMKTGILFVMMFLQTVAFAQIEGILNRAKDRIKRNARETSIAKADTERDRIDSTDFNFAVSVIDNAGMMNIRDVEERLVKATSSAVSLFVKNESEITPAQKCRDLLGFAQKLYETRRYKSAESAFVTAKVAFEAEGLTNNINYSKIFSDLGLLYATTGRYNLAAQNTEQALDIRSRTLTESHIAYAAGLNNRASLYQDLAYYNESEKDFAQAIQLVEQIKGESSEEYALVLNNQSVLLVELGRYDEATKNLQQAIRIIEAAKGSKLRNQVIYQSNLASLYQRTGKLSEAEAIYLRLEKSLGSGNPYYPGILNSLGLLYVDLKQPARAEDYLKRAAQNYKAKFGGENNPFFAKATADLGWFYRTITRYAEAEPLLTKALAIREQALGIDHPDYIRNNEELAILYWKTKSWDKAYARYKVVMDKTIDFINSYFPPMSEAEKTKFWDLTSPRFQRFFDFALDAREVLPDIVNDMFDYRTATKALLFNATNKVKQSILRSGNPQLIQDYLSWLDTKESLARYYSLSREELREAGIKVDSVQRIANQMEKSLSERSREFSAGYAVQKVGFSAIQSTLADTEAVVEVIRVRNFDQELTTDARYVIVVVTKSELQPRVVVLENGTQLETRYAKYYRNSIHQKTSDQVSYQQYFQKIEPLVSGKRLIYLSADGVYNQINVATLQKPSGEFLLNQFDWVIVGNAKDILGLKSRKAVSSKKEATLVGFPDYGGSSVDALPGTKVELENVSRILKASGFATKQFMQQGASESAVKSVKAPELLHIATHGYFLQDVEKGGSALGVTIENAKENPLLRSGLMLAGSAATVSGQASQMLSSNDNGILTAYEAMSLNLDGTDLVVLSACETGLGDVKAGEGVYGLQRAFLVAGANALIMSLWKVDDAATQQLMTNFYTNWTKTGNKARAFKQAQLQLMTKYKEPYYWGAFVMMGM